MSRGKLGSVEGVLQSRIVWPVETLLGEGPMWWPADQALWLVDIKRGTLHRYDPATDGRSTFAIGGQPSFVVPADDGSLLVGSGHALHRFREGRLGEPVATIDMPADNRTNDATVDTRGRLWFGTMDDHETQAIGGVHLFEGRSITAVGGGCVITNGPAISPDGSRLYHVDTLGGTILRFDISARDMLEDGEVFATIAPEDGTPDGVTVDAEGCLWVGLWGGWQARRYAPGGELLDTIRFPCANITKVAFGGPDLRTGYVTTARIGLGDEALAAQPLAGGLFAFDAPAPGLICPSVRLAA